MTKTTWKLAFIRNIFVQKIANQLELLQPDTDVRTHSDKQNNCIAPFVKHLLWYSWFVDFNKNFKLLLHISCSEKRMALTIILSERTLKLLETKSLQNARPACLRRFFANLINTYYVKNFSEIYHLAPLGMLVLHIYL